MGNNERHFCRGWALADSRFAHALLVVGIISTGTLSRAQAQEVHIAHPTGRTEVSRLSLRQALERGADRGPLVQMAEAPSQAARTALKKSHPLLTQSPVFQGQFGPRVSTGATTPEVIVSLTQPFSLFDLGKAQEGVARAQVQRVAREVDEARAEAAEQSGRAWLQLAYAEALLTMRALACEQAEQIKKVAQARVQYGEADASELALAEAQLVQEKASLLEAEGMHFDASLNLAYLSGEAVGVQLEAKNASYEDIKQVLSQPHADQKVHPALGLARAEAELARANIDYQKAQQSPSFSVGVQYQREGTGDQVVTGIVNLPLAFNRPWSFQTATQHMHHSRAQAMSSLVAKEIEHHRQQLLHEHSHAEQRYRLLSESGVSANLEALRVLSKQYELGAVDLTRLSLVRRNLLSAQEQLTAAEFDYHTASLQLLRVEGRLTGIAQ